MQPSSLYRKYFQKSKIFMYPLLDIKRGTSVTPIQTYLGWTNYYKPEDMKLIVVYHVRDDIEYTDFQKKILLKHPRLSDYVLLNSEKAIFTFDFADLEKDWQSFINGKYSKMNLKTKNKIRDYFDKNTGNYVYVDSYLFPNKYFDIYSELLGTTTTLLESVGELCELPNLEKEMLKDDVKDLEKTNILDFFVKK